MRCVCQNYSKLARSPPTVPAKPMTAMKIKMNMKGDDDGDHGDGDDDDDDDDHHHHHHLIII